MSRVAVGARKTGASTGQARPAAGPRSEGPGAPRRSLRHRDRQDHVLERLLRGPGPPGRRVLRVHRGRQDGLSHQAAEGRRGEHRDGEPLLCRADTPRRHPVCRRVRDAVGPAQRRPGICNPCIFDTEFARNPIYAVRELCVTYNGLHRRYHLYPVHLYALCKTDNFATRRNAMVYIARRARND